MIKVIVHYPDDMTMLNEKVGELQVQLLEKHLTQKQFYYLLDNLDYFIDKIKEDPN